MNRIIYSLLVSMLLVVLSACTGSTTDKAEDTVPVSFQLSWTHEYSSASVYVAVENGHFAEQNLDVTINEGGFGEAGYIEPIEQVVSGEADFGTAGSTSLIQARADGKPVVAVATIVRRNPFALLSLVENEITSPSDLIGKTIMVAAGNSRSRTVIFLQQQGISIEDVTLVERTTFGVEPLINGEVDVLGGWLINEAISVNEAGFEVNSILLSDYGIDDYDFVIFTTEDMVNNRPEIVERFVRGFLAGMTDVVGNSEDAVQAVLTYDSELDSQGQQDRLDAMIPLMNPAGYQMGIMDISAFELSQNILLEQGALAEPIDLNTVFTNDFLNTIYEAE